jgi:hypothetical protein
MGSQNDRGGGEAKKSPYLQKYQIARLSFPIHRFRCSGLLCILLFHLMSATTANSSGRTALVSSHVSRHAETGKHVRRSFPVWSCRGNVPSISHSTTLSFPTPSIHPSSLFPSVYFQSCRSLRPALALNHNHPLPSSPHPPLLYEFKYLATAPLNLLPPSPATLIKFSKSSPAVIPNFLTKSFAAPSKSPYSPSAPRRSSSGLPK